MERMRAGRLRELRRVVWRVSISWNIVSLWEGSCSIDDDDDVDVDVDVDVVLVGLAEFDVACSGSGCVNANISTFVNSWTR